ETVADPIPLVAAVFAAIGNEDADLAHGQDPHEPGVVHGLTTIRQVGAQLMIQPAGPQCATAEIDPPFPSARRRACGPGPHERPASASATSTLSSSRCLPGRPTRCAGRSSASPRLAR